MKPAVQQTHPDSSIPDVLWSSVAEVQGSQTHGSLLLSNHCPNPKRGRLKDSTTKPSIRRSKVAPSQPYAATPCDTTLVSFCQSDSVE